MISRFETKPHSYPNFCLYLASQLILINFSQFQTLVLVSSDKQKF